METQKQTIEGLEFAQQIQPEITKLLYDNGIELEEAKQGGKKIALICQAFAEVLR